MVTIGARRDKCPQPPLSRCLGATVTSDGRGCEATEAVVGVAETRGRTMPGWRRTWTETRVMGMGGDTRKGQYLMGGGGERVGVRGETWADKCEE